MFLIRLNPHQADTRFVFKRIVATTLNFTRDSAAKPTNGEPSLLDPIIFPCQSSSSKAPEMIWLRRSRLHVVFA